MNGGTLGVLGASGHGKVVADAALEAGWREVVFFDDRWPSLSRVGEWPVVGTGEALLSASARVDSAVVAIGECRVRLARQTALALSGLRVATVIHPRAVISSRAIVGLGVVVMAGAVVNAYAELADACIVNTGATVDHDCRLQRGVHVAPGAHLSGNVQVGECAWIGVGASVRQGLSIGSDALVGAGAVVVADVDAHATVVGCPAAPLGRTRER